MPKLKQLTCQLEWEDHEVLPEHAMSYCDGFVQCYVAVPAEPRHFYVHLMSTGYVAPGLAMFVFMDGVYQCNRNRHNLKLPAIANKKSDTEVDFRVSQKEEIGADCTFLAREWRFQPLHIGVGDNAESTEHTPPQGYDHIGSIEVVVRRCHSPRLSIEQQEVNQDGPVDDEDTQATSVKAEDNTVESVSGLGGLDEDIDASSESKIPAALGLDGHWDEPNQRQGQENAQKWGYTLTGPTSGVYHPLADSEAGPESSHTRNPHESVPEWKQTDISGLHDISSQRGPPSLASSPAWGNIPDHVSQASLPDPRDTVPAAPAMNTYTPAVLINVGTGTYQIPSTVQSPQKSIHHSTRGEPIVEQNPKVDEPRSWASQKSAKEPSDDGWGGHRSFSDQKAQSHAGSWHGSNRRRSLSDAEDNRDSARRRDRSRTTRHSISNRVEIPRSNSRSAIQGHRKTGSRFSNSRGGAEEKNSGGWDEPLTEQKDRNWDLRSTSAKGSAAHWSTNDRDKKSTELMGKWDEPRGSDDNPKAPKDESSSWKTSNHKKNQHSESANQKHGRKANKGKDAVSSQISVNHETESKSKDQSPEERVQADKKDIDDRSPKTTETVVGSSDAQSNQTVSASVGRSTGGSFKTYWNKWDDATKPGASRSEGVFVAEEPPPYILTEEVAESKFISHQIQPGKGAKYSHHLKRPVYMDSFEEPYAVFVFHYRTKELLERCVDLYSVNEPGPELGGVSTPNQSSDDAIQSIKDVTGIPEAKEPSVGRRQSNADSEKGDQIVAEGSKRTKSISGSRFGSDNVHSRKASTNDAWDLSGPGQDSGSNWLSTKEKGTQEGGEWHGGKEWAGFHSTKSAQANDDGEKDLAGRW
ncbi:MAG: hypothetical protein M1825_002309 [Sarcosagium campestre]|nr:MAG: hypothetical protein M1825_002309 [Sarcosagium campestre]